MFKRLPKCILHIIAQYVVLRPVRLKLFINPDKIDWYWLSENPAAISLLEKNPDKINWSRLSYNSSIIELDIEQYKKDLNSYALN